MLVLSRKKSEAILIDGVIRIEVINMIKAMVRVRLMAPRSLQLPHGGARKDIRDRQDTPARTAPVGMDVFHMTLVNQQVLPLGKCLNLGVVDVDKSRVLFFVDAPPGTSIIAAEPEGPDCANASAKQILLQFMGQDAERTDEHHQKPAPGTLRNGQTSIEGSSAEPDLLPFPSNQPNRHRS